MVRTTSLFVLMTGLALIAGACGSDDGETGDDVSAAISDYFNGYRVIHEDVNGRIRALDDQYPEAFRGDVQQTKNSFTEYVALYDEFLYRVNELEAPGEVEDLHEEILEGNAR